MDAEFILVSIDTPISMKQQELASINDFTSFKVGPRMANFEIFAKGPPFALKIGHFEYPLEKLPLLSQFLHRDWGSIETRINSASIHTN